MKLFSRIAAFAIFLAVAAIPLVFVPWATDPYRLPKAMLFRAAAIAVVAAAAMEIVWSGRLRWIGKRRDAVLILTAAIVVWWGISALAATNRNLSLVTWSWVLCGAVLAIATYHFAPQWNMAALLPLIVAGIVNALACLAAPFAPPGSLWALRIVDRSAGYLGSAHDAAAFLVIPALLATAAAFVDRGRRTWWIAAAAVMLAGMFTTRTAGALLAFGSGVVLMIVLRGRRAAIAAAAVVVLAAIVALASPPGRTALGAVRTRDTAAVDRILGGRILPFMAAGTMFLQHPLLGVGPGCYAWEYFPDKIALEGKYPVLLQCMTRDMQFGEAHNDHLQVLAETGAPGYLLFLAGLVVLVRTTRRADADGEWRGRFARIAGAPLALSIAVLCLAEFPFEIAASSMAILYAAALCAGWSRFGFAQGRLRAAKDLKIRTS